MSITQRWDEQDKNVIHCTIEGMWTWGEVIEAFSNVANMMSNVSYRVDLIIDMRAAGPLPICAASPHIQTALEHMPDQFGIALVEWPDTFTKAVLELVNAVLPIAKGRFRIMGEK